MNGKGSNTIRVGAEKKAAEQLEALRDRAIIRDTHEGYTRLPELNLIPGVEKNGFWTDLGAGAGNELVDGSRDPAKLCALNQSFSNLYGRRLPSLRIVMKERLNRWQSPCGQTFTKS